MTTRAELPAGSGNPRLRLYDKFWTTAWDSGTASTPAYKHITSHTLATIDYANGTRWVGEMWRCPEGICSAAIPIPEEIAESLAWHEIAPFDPIGSCP